MATKVTSTRKSSRLEARVTPTQKELIETAAQIQGRSITEFIVSTLSDVARKTIETDRVMVLSREDQHALEASLSHPAKPNSALRKAKAAHRKLIVGE